MLSYPRKALADTSMPKISKAKKLQGKTLIFRDAVIDDAAFIVMLRTDPSKGRFLSATSPDVEVQKQWLTKYGQAEDQAYFIIENMAEEPLGTVRLYDPRGTSFCWGSWILKENAPQSAAIESALIVYQYAINHLGFESAHFDVRKDNVKVWQFHERFGAIRIGETEQDYLYEISSSAISTALEKYRRFLPHPITVEL